MFVPKEDFSTRPRKLKLSCSLKHTDFTGCIYGAMEPKQLHIPFKYNEAKLCELYSFCY